jgi:hypothetical protein
MAQEKRVAAPTRPRYLEYYRPHGRARRWCCYKDDPCELHASVLKQLVRMALGEIEADPKNLTNHKE